MENSAKACTDKCGPSKHRVQPLKLLYHRGTLKQPLNNLPSSSSLSPTTNGGRQARSEFKANSPTQGQGPTKSRHKNRPPTTCSAYSCSNNKAKHASCKQLISQALQCSHRNFSYTVSSPKHSDTPKHGPQRLQIFTPPHGRDSFVFLPPHAQKTPLKCLLECFLTLPWPR